MPVSTMILARVMIPQKSLPSVPPSNLSISILHPRDFGPPQRLPIYGSLPLLNPKARLSNVLSCAANQDHPRRTPPPPSSPIDNPSPHAQWACVDAFGTDAPVNVHYQYEQRNAHCSGARGTIDVVHQSQDEEKANPTTQPSPPRGPSLADPAQPAARARASRRAAPAVSDPRLGVRLAGPVGLVCER
ncbi:hypothetical protein EJ06DRAFT_520504 [Trichodelitschia bisporula]|uniref:Uncharacterized protein n=1 Tax=Trichodelitschia bisporula TaxID=703511 RepID=A0A6G1I2Y3_9PEZI|nr:hypothetical protein EJ06DRAFT_520504 [Trichodelitschia bisporula]